jgi:tripartite-type tricarboxylate transporter receptor subunit TctC
MKLRRRKFLNLATVVATLPFTSRVWAQTYPTRPVRIIVGELRPTSLRGS